MSRGHLDRAVVTQAPQLHLDPARCERLRRLATVPHLDGDLGQALDAAAVGAGEVGVLARFLGSRPLKLEAPDMVSEVATPHQPRLGEIEQVAVERRAIDAFALE